MSPIGHPHGPVLPGGHQLDGKGLDNGDQRHIGVGGHSDGAHIVGVEHLGDQDGGGTVGGADDTDGGGVLHIEAQGSCQQDGEEDARLGGGAAQKQLGVGQQRAEVDHGSDADKQQNGQGLAGADAHLKEPLDDAVGLPHPGSHLVNDPRRGQIHQNGTKPHGHEQSGLKSLFNGQPDEQSAHQVHDQLLPGDGQQTFPQKFHVPFLPCVPHRLFLEIRGAVR